MWDFAKLEGIAENLKALGLRRFALLATAAMAIIATIVLGSFYLSKPDFDTLYSGLSQQDVSRIGAALAEAGISFDVSPDGTKVLVAPRDTAKARMLLAEKGLPASATAGYELFDKLGSMGLTSFMQEVTRVRALEGELSRSIQTIRGVRAARVHIVMPSNDSFRRDRQKASASVMVKLDGMSEMTSAKAIRHLVAAAVPGMSIEQVQVVTTDGTVLAAEGDLESELPSKMIELERTVSKELEDRVRRTLTPYLGADNFEVSVAAKINMDKRQINETTYDPKSKVERSTRVERQADNSQNSNQKSAVGVEQNIPGEDTGQVGGETSKRTNERRQELTNFEINSKSVQTESMGYRLDQMTVAVLINRKRMVEAAGGTVVAGSLDSRLKEVEALVRSSAGTDPQRGDQVTVAAVDFLQSANAFEPAPSSSIVETLVGQLGSVIRSLTIVGVAALLILFGFRPVTRLLLEQAEKSAAIPGGALGGEKLAVAAPPGPQLSGLPPPDDDSENAFLEELSRASGKTPTKRLEKIVNLNEEQAAAVLRQWLQQARSG